MNQFFKTSVAVIMSFVFATNVYSATSYDPNSRVLSAPLWMPYNILADNENTPVATTDEMLSEQDMGFCKPYGNGQMFTNLLDGYSIVIPSGMSVDLSMSDTCATISDATTSLRIFKESFSTYNERLSYLVYSNKFTSNTANHYVTKEQSYKSGDKEYHILEWSRGKLSAIQEDKNFYSCIDVCIGARVYTFFFNSSIPFTQNSAYMEIVNSLSTFDPVVPQSKAYNKGYKKNDISRLNSYAAATYQELFSDDASFKMGMFAPDKFGGFAGMEEFEKQLSYKFCAFLLYTEVAEVAGSSVSEYQFRVSEYLTSIEKNFKYARQSGKAIELTLQTPLNRQAKTGSNMIYEILNGEYEYFLGEYAKLIARYPDVTVLFRPFNEMNGDWCNYSAYHTSRDPKLYVELYRYIHNIFDKNGCDNTIWVWNPNERSFPNYKWNSQNLYYPGDEYVDVYGITGYNTGTYYEGETWRSFDEIYSPIYERALRINEKPIMITEFSCSAIGGDKIQWIEDMFTVLPKYDKIKVGIWWHATDYDGEMLSRPYFMDTPYGTMDVFDKYLN